MQDFKNIAKVVGLLLALMVWFYYQLHLNVSYDDTKAFFVKQESTKEYDFRIVSCRDYRGFNFVGIGQNKDTVSCNIDYIWNLRDQFNVGDRIVKRRGSKIMYLIKPNGDSITIHMMGRKGDYFD